MRKIINGNYISKDRKGDFEFGNMQSQYEVTPRYFKYGGKTILPRIGEFHFSRYDNALWGREIAKMKAEGLDGIAVYVFWNHHEVKCGKFDFVGDKDIAKFLKLCKKYDMKVVLRVGPWCHGEARFGGFPDYLRLVPLKRKSTPLYMKYVKRFWSKLYAQVKDFCDGTTIVGMQMENEYPGSIQHIYDLRKMCEEIGFRVPFFTMTKWPTDAPTKYLLPLEGGYPEAPWTWHKRPLEPNGRFVIASESNDSEIGEDLIKKQRQKVDFSAFPMAGCEIGTGNQVTAHRRPVISDKDGYGIGFAKLASGMNWMGYYMYHGGRNPNYRPLQESKITLYPNNYPMIDYDFQAAISKDGKVRKQGDRLRLMHTFIENWDSDFARTQAFFAKDKVMPYFSVRADEKSGYVFVSNYERGLVIKDEILDIDIDIDNIKMNIFGVKVPKDSIYFFPFNCVIGGVKFDYITAQPILKRTEDNVVVAYFMKIDGVDVRICIDNKATVCNDNEYTVERNNTKVLIKFLNESQALKLHHINNKVMFSNSSIYEYDDKLVCEMFEGDNVVENGKILVTNSDKADKNLLSLKEIAPIKLPYNYFMYSKGKRKFYELKIDNKVFDNSDDLEITLDFVGLNLQIFHNGQIVDDYFNTDGKCVFRLARLKKLLDKDNTLIIRACAKTASGVGCPYNEIKIPNSIIDIKIDSVKTIKFVQI